MLSLPNHRPHIVPSVELRVIRLVAIALHNEIPVALVLPLGVVVEEVLDGVPILNLDVLGLLFDPCPEQL